jgi:hypothetical protein
MRNTYKIWLEILKGSDNSVDPGIDGRIILKLIFGNRMGECGLGLSGLRYRLVACSCEHGNEPSSYIMLR